MKFRCNSDFRNVRAPFIQMVVAALLLGGAWSYGEEMDPVNRIQDKVYSAEKNLILFPDKVAYILTDDSDGGYKAFTDRISEKLTARGYLVHRLQNDALQTVLKDVQRRNLVTSKVLIIVNGHGTAPYAVDGILTDWTDWAQHSVPIGTTAGAKESVFTSRLAILARELRRMGKQIVVMDNSCSGGATVKYFEHEFPNDEQVCAMATTGSVTPSAVGLPPFELVFNNRNYSDFEDVGGWGSKFLIESAKTNYRVHQYCYMNGCSRTMQLREGLSVAMGSLSTWPEWNRYRHNHVYLEPKRYINGDRNDPGHQDFGPSPDERRAADGFENYALRNLRDLQTANILFAWGHRPIPEVSEAVMRLYDQIRNDLKKQLELWQNTFIWSDFYARRNEVCGLNLAEYVRGLLWNRPCGVPVVPIPPGTPCTQADRDHLTRYRQLACSYPEKIVPELLEDYPIVGRAIARYREMEQQTQAMVVSLSTFMYENIEGPLCQPAACRECGLE